LGLLLVTFSTTAAVSLLWMLLALQGTGSGFMAVANAATVVAAGCYLKHLSRQDLPADARWLAMPAAARVLLVFGLSMAVRLAGNYWLGLNAEKVPMAAAALCALLVLERTAPAEFGLRGRHLKAQLCAGLVLVLCYAACRFVAQLVPTACFGSVYGVKLVTSSPLEAFPKQLLAYGYSNFAEEVCFRGYALRVLSEGYGGSWGMVAQALLFGLYHINYHLFPPRWSLMAGYVLFAAVAGVSFGVIYRRLPYLLPVTLVHVSHNMNNRYLFPQLLGATRLNPWVHHLLTQLVMLALALAVMGPLASFLGRRLGLLEEDGAPQL